MSERHYGAESGCGAPAPTPSPGASARSAAPQRCRRSGCRSPAGGRDLYAMFGRVAVNIKTVSVVVFALVVLARLANSD